MKIVVYSPSEETLKEQDYRQWLRIEIDGKRVFSVADGEPEDANLARDFSDCWGIISMMEKAYEAGKAGEPFEYCDVEE